MKVYNLCKCYNTEKPIENCEKPAVDFNEFVTRISNITT